MSWRFEKSGLIPDYRYKGFHRSNYAEPANAKATDLTSHDRQRYGLVQHFKEPGIEVKSEAIGLAYGSDKKYNLESQNKRLSFNEEMEKKQRQLNDLEEYMAERKREKASIEASRAEQKQKDLEMLQKYQPWGKPAGGAPRVTVDGERVTQRHRLDWEFQSDGDQILPFGRPGGGAPRRTGSGSLQTTIVGDPSTRFQRSCKKDVDHVLRYKCPGRAQEYAKSLDMQVLEQYPKERHQAPYQDSNYHPYGKPGGGAPLQSGGLMVATRKQFENDEEDANARKQKTLRYARRLEQQRIEAITRRAKESDELKQTVSYDPWEKSHPLRDGSGNVVRHRQTLRHKMAADLDVSSNEATTTPKPRIPRTFGVHGEGTIVDSAIDSNVEMFDPWGKPGAGAPLKSKDGQVVTATQSYFKGNKRPASNEKVVTSPRNTSDVITERLGIKRQADANSRNYHNELERQAELRYQQKQMEKAAEQRMATEHATRERQLWGCNANPDPIRKTLADPTEVQVKKEKAANYHSELTQLTGKKYEEKIHQRDQNLLQDQQHLTMFSTQWGRPGGGAPRTDDQGRLDTVRRLNLLSNTSSVYNRRRS